MKGFPIMEIIGNTIKAVVTFFDDAYAQGWLLYLIIGLVVLVVVVLLYS